MVYLPGRIDVAVSDRLIHDLLEASAEIYRRVAPVWPTVPDQRPPETFSWRPLPLRPVCKREPFLGDHSGLRSVSDRRYRVQDEAVRVEAPRIMGLRLAELEPQDAGSLVRVVRLHGVLVAGHADGGGGRRSACS